MRPAKTPLFLARQGYRRRRLADAARLLPILGVFLFLIPVLATAPHGWPTLRGGIYVFLVWFGLIAAAAVLSRWLSADEDQGGGDDGDPG